MRIAAIDHGTKRIGLAVSDPQRRMALPLGAVEVAAGLQEDARRVLAACEEYEVSEFVVGLPLNMDDSEGPQAQSARAFGSALSQLSRRPVHFWDERLSSFAADELFRGQPLTRGKRKARRDALAAQIILQEFLDALLQDPTGRPNQTGGES